MIIEDKLSSNELSQDDRANLILWHNIFTMQEAFYNDSSNSFVTDTEANITTNSKYNRKNIKYAYTLPILQPSFGSIFNYGFFNKPKTRKQKAEALVNRYATATAAESALLLHVATPEIETGALTATTIKMCHHICKTYEMSGGAITALAAQVSGQLAGKAMANYGKNLILKLIPDAGNAINATTTYAIHEMQGRAIIEWCEKNYRNKEVADWDKLANGFRLFKFFCSMGPNPADVLGEDGMQ